MPKEAKPLWKNYMYCGITMHIMLDNGDAELLFNCKNIRIFKKSLTIDGRHFSSDNPKIQAGCQMMREIPRIDRKKVNFAGYKASGKNAGVVAMAFVGNAEKALTRAEVGALITEISRLCNDCEHCKTMATIRCK